MVGSMPDHAIVNLEAVDDLAPEHGFSESQEVRFARDLLGCQSVGISLQRVKPGKRHAFGHRHAKDEEVYVVLEGAGSVRLGEDTVEVRRMDAIRVAPEVARGFEAGPEGLTLLAFGSHHPEDFEVLPGFWDDDSA
jgi:uncharacterized cupin superfamily protein